MSTATVFLHTEKAFDTTWHPGLLYKLPRLQFSANMIKLISSFLTNKNFRVTVEGELSTPREIQAGVPQGSIPAPTVHNLYINDAPQTPGVQLTLFADYTCIYATKRKEDYVLRKLQRGLTALEAWCETWTGRGPSYIERTEQTFVKHVKYFGVIFI
jgi:hypothetical protein